MSPQDRRRIAEGTFGPASYREMLCTIKSACKQIRLRRRRKQMNRSELLATIIFVNLKRVQRLSSGIVNESLYMRP